VRRLIGKGIERTAGLLMDQLERGEGRGLHWEGRLSDSALSTSVAALALSLADRQRFQGLIEGGIYWLRGTQNEDGGWGDTPGSLSNMSTSLLAWCALTAAPGSRESSHCERRVEGYLRRQTGGLSPDDISREVRAVYGQDKTFSAPILATCALAGRMGQGKDAWRLVPGLPFEVSCLPQGFFRLVRLPVVSYAIPALIAVGLVAFRRKGAKGLSSFLRRASVGKSLDVLSRTQPANGGFLEATPLTSFVVMCLCGAGEKDHEVVRKGVSFLERSVRREGSWPIDTHLATWVTTSAVSALSSLGGASPLGPVQREGLLQWILEQQFTEPHPFTGAAPGGWAWTPLPGGVPDADDTAGALVALAVLDPGKDRSREPAENGVLWLLNLQNRDGGFPTFCKGWGRLPFDRSCPDITAHAVKAFRAWLPHLSAGVASKANRSLRRAVQYLNEEQGRDGSWLPLWFGNQEASNHRNPTYGTAKVVQSCDDLPGAGKGLSFLDGSRNEDGGWGGGPGAASSIEETALALQALSLEADRYRSAIASGLHWLDRATDNFQRFPPAPIGLYFSSLWYAEELYPLIFTLQALSSLAPT